MSAVDRFFVALGVVGAVLLGVGEWLRREPACRFANLTGDDE